MVAGPSAVAMRRPTPKAWRSGGNRETGAPPTPRRKRIDSVQGVLPKRDQNKADTVGALISMDAWGGMVMKGNPLASGASLFPPARGEGRDAGGGGRVKTWITSRCGHGPAVRFGSRWAAPTERSAMTQAPDASP